MNSYAAAINLRDLTEMHLTADSLYAAGQLMLRQAADSTAATFFQEMPVELIEQPLTSSGSDWIIYVLLTLIAGLALIIFYAPDKLTTIREQLMVQGQLRSADRSAAGSGILVQGFLLVNYLITMSLFVWFGLQKFWPNAGAMTEIPVVMTSLASIVFLLFFFRLGMIRFLGFIFETRFISVVEQKLYYSTDFLTGLILLPVTLLAAYWENRSIFFAGIVIIFIILIFRWFQTFILGKSIPGVLAIHIIVYLCTLEIAPFLLVIKAAQSIQIALL